MILPLNRKLLALGNEMASFSIENSSQSSLLLKANKKIYQLNTAHNYVSSVYTIETDFEDMIVQTYPYQNIILPDTRDLYEYNYVLPTNGVEGLLASYIIEFANFPIEYTSCIRSEIILKSPYEDSSNFWLGLPCLDDSENTYKHQRYFEYKSATSFRYHHTLTFWVPIGGIYDYDNSGHDTSVYYTIQYIVPQIPKFQSKLILTINSPPNY